ncbi:hypothetical protein PEC302110_24820 [Pectobacterium araliae]|uniref:Uncharacterized protein n=1 Tax=Pectobacterium araliae TaxID=3073862 RepID=A0AAN0KBF5_9GAMM|nr:hypothetical protein PEC302110_24820 [Pectobacterium sp. MAFF 302110]
MASGKKGLRRFTSLLCANPFFCMKILIQPVESFPEDERQNFFDLWLFGLDHGVGQRSALIYPPVCNMLINLIRAKQKHTI